MNHVNQKIVLEFVDMCQPNWSIPRLSTPTLCNIGVDIGCGSDLRAVGASGFCMVCAVVPLSGRIELLLVQTGQKGQAGRLS